MRNLKLFAIGAAILSLIGASSTWCAVTAQEAAKLKSELTPMGGEKAGNKDGTIPAWTGGYTTLPAGYKPGEPRPDVFAGEKPLYSITAQNLAQYADKLSDGQQALLKKYPSSYRIDVYPTHRTAAMPEWAYEGTLKNATRCKTTNSGLSIENCYGGIPFPVPKDGYELMWNHLLAWKGQANSMLLQIYITPANGKPILVSDSLNEIQFPYWLKDGSPDKFSGDYLNIMLNTTGPPYKAGEALLIRDSVDAAKGRQAWQYLVGQRRTRKAPSYAYDTPDNVSSGVSYADEVYVFLGSLDRYEWNILGKKEMYVPYNSNRTWLVKPLDVLGPQHLNPNHIRWELHRVWVVEASLAPGKRHVSPKRRFYLDEDTYHAVLSDSWDAQGQLWRTGYGLPMVMPDVPGSITQTFGIYNLIANTYMLANYPGDEPYQFKQVQVWPESYFTPDNMAAKGTR